MRLRHAAALLLSLLPASAVADDPIVAVDCLCVEEEQGWVRGRSDATPAEAGLESLTTGESFLQLRAEADRCTKYADSCGDERYTPVTGDRRMRLDGIDYMDSTGRFKLTVEGTAAPPAGPEPLIEVDCLCVWEDMQSLAALGDEPAGRLGVSALTPSETVVRFKGRGCTAHPTACADPFAQATGEVRATITYFEYPGIEGQYRLRVNGAYAAP